MFPAQLAGLRRLAIDSVASPHEPNMFSHMRSK